LLRFSGTGSLKITGEVLAVAMAAFTPHCLVDFAALTNPGDGMIAEGN